MLTVNVITIHPTLVEAYSGFGVFSSAEKKKLAKLHTINLRDFAVDKHGSVDDHPFGGGDGMVLRPEPLTDALKTLGDTHVISTSPTGKLWSQTEASRLASINKPLTFVCGRFGGIDQRFIDKYVDEEYSIGDFVLSGGELPALSMIDTILRLIPGVLGNEKSAKEDSFSEEMNGLLEYPLYTRPMEFEGVKVPDVLVSGNHKAIDEWKDEMARKTTAKKRPDLLNKKS